MAWEGLLLGELVRKLLMVTDGSMMRVTDQVATEGLAMVFLEVEELLQVQGFLVCVVVDVQYLNNFFRAGVGG